MIWSLHLGIERNGLVFAAIDGTEWLLRTACQEHQHEEINGAGGFGGQKHRAIVGKTT
jgi:hypothetical protein